MVVQQLVDADCAGVLFTRNPLDGADELVIEAAWGLGEAVVAGLVTPDRFRVARDGTVLERVAGAKDLAVTLAPDGGTEEVAISGERVRALCLGDSRSRRWLGSPSGAATCSGAPATSNGHSQATSSTCFSAGR